MDINELKEYVDAKIYDNGRQEITGNVLNGVLRETIDTLDAEVTAEAKTREEADKALSAKIATEASDRATADTELQESITELEKVPIWKGATSDSLTGNYSGNNAGTYGSAFGYKTTAGQSAFAEGTRTRASGLNSHSEGASTEASGLNSHAEGDATKAMQRGAHSEGASTTASAIASHAEGVNATAKGKYSHAEGQGTSASTEAGHAQGKYNEDVANAVDMVGIGTADDERKNAELTLFDGKKYVINVGGFDGTSESITSGAKSIQEVLSSSSNLKYYDITVEYNDEDEVDFPAPWTVDEIKSLVTSGVQPVIRLTVHYLYDSDYFTVLPAFDSNYYVYYTFVGFYHKLSSFFLESKDDTTLTLISVVKESMSVRGTAANLPTATEAVVVSGIDMDRVFNALSNECPVNIRLSVTKEGITLEGYFQEYTYGIFITDNYIECPYRLVWNSDERAYYLSLNYYDNLYVVDNSQVTEAVGRPTVNSLIIVHDGDRNSHPYLSNMISTLVNDEGIARESADSELQSQIDNSVKLTGADAQTIEGTTKLASLDVKGTTSMTGDVTAYNVKIENTADIYELFLRGTSAWGFRLKAHPDIGIKIIDSSTGIVDQVILGATLTQAIGLWSGANIDDYKTPNVRWWTHNANATLSGTLPDGVTSADRFRLEVLPLGDSYVEQRLTVPANGSVAVYTRVYDGRTWGDWV